MQKIFGEFWSLWQCLEHKGDNWTKLNLRPNPSGKWVIVIFSGQKPCTRIIFNNNNNNTLFKYINAHKPDTLYIFEKVATRLSL